MQNRAWSTLEIKSIDQHQRIIEGVASTPSLDRGGDMMDPKGAQFSLPLPFLWFHNAQSPIGEVFEANVRPDGIHIKARVSRVSTPGRLKTLVDEAWAAFTASPPLVRGLSIGWSPIDVVPVPGSKAQRVLKWFWGELSAVTIPMNIEASITAVKQCDAPAPAVSGIGRPSSSPGAPGFSSKVTTMNVSEQLTGAKSDLQIKSDRLQALMTQDEQHGGLEGDDATERDTLLKDIPALTSRVKQYQTLEDAQLAQARPFTTVAAVQRTTTAPKVELPPRVKGQGFVRYAMAVAAGKGSLSDTLAYAKRFTDTPEVAAYVKSLHFKAEPGTSVVSSPAWGGELVNPSTLETEFIELLRPETIIGKVSGFRPVPFNIPIITQTGGSTFGWVGEAGTKQVSELSFTRDTLGYSKAAGIVVLTEELVRLSRPDAEATVRNDMVEQCASFLDAQFIQVGVAAGANNPASITNGVTSPAATGADLQSFTYDLKLALATFVAADIPLTGLVIVTTPTIALGISLFTNALGQTPNGFNVTPTGGTLLGYPVIVSESVNAGTLVIFKPSEVFLADDGRVTLDASNQATLDMMGGSPGAPTFNLWQRNCVGIRAERWIRWQKRRAGAVAVIDTAAYGPSLGSP